MRLSSIRDQFVFVLETKISNHDLLSDKGTILQVYHTKIRS